MTIAKLLATAIVLSVNLASPAFSSDTGRKVHKVHRVSHYSLRSYCDPHNQFGAPSSSLAQRNIQNFGFSGRDRSYPGGWDPDLRPSD
jgi:hypothetical protein